MAQPADMVALLDGLVSSRVFRNQAPLGTATPYIVFAKIVGVPVNHLGGTDGTKNTRFQLDAWAADADAAEALMNSIKAAFEPFEGVYVQIGDNPDLYDDDVKLHRASTDFSVWHT